MLSLSPAVKLWYCPEAVDMRLGFDGLFHLVANRLKADPLSGHLFIFHNQRRSALKMLWWEAGGFCLLYKRLAKGRFRLPPVEGGMTRVNREQLRLLLDGFDLTSVRRLPRWNPEEKTSAK